MKEESLRQKLKPQPHWAKEFFAQRNIPQAWLAAYLNLGLDRMSYILSGAAPCPPRIEEALQELRQQALLEETADE